LRCPPSIKIQKEDCKNAGLAVGGLLTLDLDIIEGSWTDRPIACFFGPEIYYNTNPHGINVLDPETVALGNVALGKSTYQFVDDSSDAQKAVDGNISGYWVDGSVTHTSADPS